MLHNIVTALHNTAIAPHNMVTVLHYMAAVLYNTVTGCAAKLNYNYNPDTNKDGNDFNKHKLFTDEKKEKNAHPPQQEDCAVKRGRK